MPNKPSNLTIVDGSGYIFRAYFAIRPLSAPDGTPTHALLGFARMLNKLIQEKQPEHLVIAFDTKGPLFRHQLYPEYKAHRQQPPEDLLQQIPLILELVEHLNIPQIRMPGYEADDIIATIVHHARAQNHTILIASGDKDLLSLVDAQVCVYDPMKERLWDTAAVVEHYGIEPRQFPDLLALAGDSSDNIPGVPRIGLKTAAKLLREYDSLSHMLVTLPQKKGLQAAERSILEHRENAELSRQLVELATDVPVPFVPQKWQYPSTPRESLGAFLQRYRLRSLHAIWPETASVAQPAAVATEIAAKDAVSVSQELACPIVREQYQTIQSEEALRAWLDRAAQTTWLSVDLETTSLQEHLAEIVGFALKIAEHPSVYIPVGHLNKEGCAQLPKELVLQHMKALLENPKILKVGQNLKYDMNVLRHHGIALEPVAGDAMLAAYVLNPTSGRFGLDYLSQHYLDHQTISFAEVIGKSHIPKQFSGVPIQDAAVYAAEDADVAFHLCKLLHRKLVENHQNKLYEDVELPLIPVLSAMECQGLLLDIVQLKKLGEEYAQLLLEIEAEVMAEVGEPLNLSSPKQLGYLLFDKMGLPGGKKNKIGYSTDQNVLESLALLHPLPQKILRYRSLEKLKSTYTDALLRWVHPDTGRVHTHFNQTFTHTGRLSSSHPNLQNIPIQGEEGTRIRSTFIAEPGWKLISIDYSQIELRILAHLSQDENMMQAFSQGMDIHQMTADKVLNHLSMPAAQKRRMAKAINFGVLYGLTPFGLSKQLNISREQAKAFIDDYFGIYHGVRQYMELAIEGARERGYTETLLGRRRPVAGITSQHIPTRQAEERIAMNTPVQGSAADLIKLAMIAVYRAFKQSGTRARLLLQVHDELVIESPNEEALEIAQRVSTIMTEVLPLRVPLEVSCSVADNWADAHPG